MKGQFIILYYMLDEMESPQNAHINKVSQHSSKCSKIFVINLLPILPIYHLGHHLGQEVKLSLLNQK
jgi:hypothetical protein